uniref:TonB-dependent receptor n=1 Tax=Litorivivens sp. TaxID=2020868 RepID=UPI00356397FF
MGKVTKAIIAAGAVALVPEVSLAQQRNTQLEEVVVTAQKREESLQDTPISLAAFSGDQLDQFGIDDLGDITARTPNVDITPFPNSRSSLVIFMRGVGNNDSQTTQDPAVGVYIDGVYVGRSVGLTSDVADLARIEVLRGPQGTLYGRNTTGGAINMISARPDEEFGIKSVLATGNRDYRKGTLQLDTGAWSGLSAKISYSKSEKGPWVDNINGSNDFVEEEREAGRFVLRWDISDTLSMDYAYDISEIVGPQPYYQVLRINEDRAVTAQDVTDAIAGGASQDDINALQADLIVTNLFTPQFRERASEKRLSKGEWDVPVEDSVTE